MRHVFRSRHLFKKFNYVPFHSPMSRKDPRKRSRSAETLVLIRSRRRCCVCFGLNQDASEKKGQIAHLDHDRTNNDLTNLAFLCLAHHDQYDSQSSQSKSLQLEEVKAFRDELYQYNETVALNSQRRTGETQAKEKERRLTAKMLNAYLAETPHKCSYCGYSFWVIPNLEEGKRYFVKTATCPKCSNVDEVWRFYEA
jgi:hypothetical protein